MGGEVTVTTQVLFQGWPWDRNRLAGKIKDARTWPAGRSQAGQVRRPDRLMVPAPAVIPAAGHLEENSEMTVSRTGTKPTAYRVLGIYLNDHLAGATAGTELAHRVARTHDDDRLRRFAVEVAQDRVTLLDLMKALGVPVRVYKTAAAWIGEKAGRIKPNGHLLTRSPLSYLEELEIMRLGVEGKAAGWRTLRALADTDPRLDQTRLDDLITAAQRQSGLIEELRIQAAADLIAAEQTSSNP